MDIEGISDDTVMGDEGVVRIAPVMGETFGVPRRLGRGRLEERAGFVEIAEAGRARTTMEERRESVRAPPRRVNLAGKCAEFFGERGGLEERELCARRKIVGESRRGIGELHAGRGGEADALDAGARALRDRIEFTD